MYYCLVGTLQFTIIYDVPIWIHKYIIFVYLPNILAKNYVVYKQAFFNQLLRHSGQMVEHHRACHRLRHLRKVWQ